MMRAEQLSIIAINNWILFYSSNDLIMDDISTALIEVSVVLNYPCQYCLN